MIKLIAPIVESGLALLPPAMTSDRARVEMLAICGQEADFTHRWQVVDPDRPLIRGPARGLWQFERGGGTRGVLEHHSTELLAADVCRLRGVPATPAAVWPQLAEDDILAAVFARLLLYTDPAPLPKLGDEQGGWEMYLRNWRPGAYTNGTPTKRAQLRRKWAGYYPQALDAVQDRPDFSSVVSSVSSSEDKR